MSKPSGKKKGVVVTVYWNDESFSLQLTAKKWDAIKSGESMTIKGDGYSYEGEDFVDYWTFTGGLEGRLIVEYGEDGGVGFEGSLADAEIAYL